MFQNLQNILNDQVAAQIEAQKNFKPQEREDFWNADEYFNEYYHLAEQVHINLSPVEKLIAERQRTCR